MISPSEAKLAITPAMVGLVRTDMNNPPFLLSLSRAALVFAICIRDISPSYILAPPPDPDTIMSGSFSLSACSIILAIFSPTTDPIEPIIKRESVAPIATRLPFIVPSPTTTASFMPVAF